MTGYAIYAVSSLTRLHAHAAKSPHKRLFPTRIRRRDMALNNLKYMIFFKTRRSRIKLTPSFAETIVRIYPPEHVPQKQDRLLFYEQALLFLREHVLIAPTIPPRGENALTFCRGQTKFG
jgi:hypothetical protein